VAAGARNISAGGVGSGKLQQFGQRGRPGLMHGRTHGHLQGFQIPPPRLATGAKGNAQQLFYFARDFLLDRFDRFFP
jgi:hypothetical protein